MKLHAQGKASTWFVYQKMIIVFLAFLVPLVATSIWLNFRGLSLTKNTILDSSSAGASFYSKQLDKEMYFIRNLQLQLLSDTDLQKLGFRGSKLLGSYEEVELIEQVRNRLATLTASSDYVVAAGVYVGAVGKTISTGSGVTSTPNEEYLLIASLAAAQPKPSFYREGNRIFFIETENIAGIWSYIEISEPKLLEALGQIASLYNQSEVLLSNRERGIVLSTDADARRAADVTRQFGEGDEREPGLSYSLKVGGKSYVAIRHEVSSLGLSLITYVNQSELTRSLSRFNTWIYLLFGIAVAFIAIYSFSLHFMIHRPLSKLVKAFHMIETDNLNLSIVSKTKDEFHYLFNSFNRMAYRLKRSIEDNYEQRIALQHSQLKQLQSQINPHFLYNSFFNIYMMCKVGDPENAAELSQKLGSYYQYITRSGSDEVPIFKEYQHALDYCEIQCIRFSNRIRYEHEELPAEASAVSVPRLIIQPLVENAFEHAFEDEQASGTVYIGADIQDGSVRITVEDTGTRLTDERIERLRETLARDSKQIEKTGLINVNNRLQLKYGPGSGLFVSRSAHGGLKVELIIRHGTKEA
ncbi:sensor histidine kinase [Cohnella sp. 56]|uniref:sensor histidine kinase n=1 Tax=Cohnella sp. 56 TaxID=3113722 RepID=UPI0030E8C68B